MDSNHWHDRPELYRISLSDTTKIQKQKVFLPVSGQNNSDAKDNDGELKFRQFENSYTIYRRNFEKLDSAEVSEDPEVTN
jgi:hypothetical protein